MLVGLDNGFIVLRSRWLYGLGDGSGAWSERYPLVRGHWSVSGVGILLFSSLLFDSRERENMDIDRGGERKEGNDAEGG